MSSIVRSHAEFAALSERTRFISISLREPLKADVLAWAAGGEAPPREAEVVILDQGAQATVEALVALEPAAVTSWVRRTDIQPMAVISELMEAEELVRLHPEFQAAMARRGITDFDAIQVDAWPAGHFGAAEEDGRRLSRCVAFIKPHPGDSEWARDVAYRSTA